MFTKFSSHNKDSVKSAHTQAQIMAIQRSNKYPATQIFKGLWTTMAGFPNAVFFNEASTPDLSTGLKIWRIAPGFVPP